MNFLRTRVRKKFTRTQDRRFSVSVVGVGGAGFLGRPRTRSPTMLRWIWLVPPQIVSEREKKNADIIGLTG